VFGAREEVVMAIVEHLEREGDGGWNIVVDVDQHHMIRHLTDTMIPVKPWVRVWYCLGTACHNPHPYL
jgi:hypothetical protein